MKSLFRRENEGFTLIELLIVVLIIGVLTAVALPQYQAAVDKSRYATLMPMARSLATAQESFLMANGHYSNNLSDLDVQFPGNPSGKSGTISGDITAAISDDSGYDYVKMSKEGLNNNYILYLNKSGNYKNEVHCEALQENARAERLCKTLGGQLISGSVTDGYDTYVLEGIGDGQPMSHGPVSGPCTKYTGSGTCTQYQNSDGTFWEERACSSSGGCSDLYDQNGNLLAHWTESTDYYEMLLSDGTLLQFGMGSNGIENLTVQDGRAIDPITGEETRQDINFSSDGNVTISYGDMGDSFWSYDTDGNVKRVYYTVNTGDEYYYVFDRTFNPNGSIKTDSVYSVSNWTGQTSSGNPYDEWDNPDGYMNWEMGYQDIVDKMSNATSGNAPSVPTIDSYKTQYCNMNPNSALCS